MTTIAVILPFVCHSLRWLGQHLSFYIYILLFFCFKPRKKTKRHKESTLDIDDNSFVKHELDLEGGNRTDVDHIIATEKKENAEKTHRKKKKKHKAKS